MGIFILIFLFLLMVIAANSGLIDVSVSDIFKLDSRARDKHEQQKQKREEKRRRKEQKRAHAIAKQKREERNKKLEDVRNQARKDIEQLTKDMLDGSDSKAPSLNRAGMGGVSSSLAQKSLGFQGGGPRGNGGAFTPPGAVMPGLDSTVTPGWHQSKSNQSGKTTPDGFSTPKSKLSRF